MATEVGLALDEAGRSYDIGDFARAYACADLAAELMPQAVASHHLRAAALSALGRYEMAQVAFAMALALDPEDPETLADAADFFINVFSPKRRSNIMVGLEYARRGSDRVATRRHVRRSLHARLLLLQAEGYNDLGRADMALPRVDQAVELSRGMVEARHERGVSLFNLCKFEEAEQEFVHVLRERPADPFAHHHLGLIYERAGRDADARAHFARAVELAPSEFYPAVEISEQEFQAELDEAISEQSAEVQKLLKEVSVIVLPVPELEDLTAVDPPFSPTIMGLFRGLPAGADDGHQLDAIAGPAGPDGTVRRSILLYRNNLGRAVHTREDLDSQIRRTLVHEIGHLQGLDEGELRRRGLE